MPCVNPDTDSPTFSKSAIFINKYISIFELFLRNHRFDFIQEPEWKNLQL